MPDFDGASRAIEQYFAANFTTLAAKLIRYEDTPWKPEGTELDEWIELYIRHGGAQNISVGNVVTDGGLRTRYAGLVMAHIYTRELTGTRRGLVLADAFGTVFQNKTISGVVFREARVIDSTSPNAAYQRKIVQVNFQRDETT